MSTTAAVLAAIALMALFAVVRALVQVLLARRVPPRQGTTRKCSGSCPAAPLRPDPPR